MFSVGILYSSQEFLEFVHKERILFADCLGGRGPFELSAIADVANLSARCGWTRIDEDGVCILTEKGLNVTRELTVEKKVRRQILDFIDVEQPKWSVKSSCGRSEALRMFPEPVKQIFDEAGLCEAWTEELIQWWDAFSLKARFLKNSYLHRVGRDAERKSFDHELRRTGRDPVWKSLDTDFAGYDIQSVDRGAPLYIEVKGSERRFKEADFSVSRHEWEVSCDFPGYCFHLWLLTGTPRLFVVDAKVMMQYFPQDQLSGRWQNVRIPVSAFSSFEQNAVL